MGMEEAMLCIQNFAKCHRNKGTSVILLDAMDVRLRSSNNLHDSCNLYDFRLSCMLLLLALSGMLVVGRTVLGWLFCRILASA